MRLHTLVTTALATGAAGTVLVVGLLGLMEPVAPAGIEPIRLTPAPAATVRADVVDRPAVPAGPKAGSAPRKPTAPDPERAPAPDRQPEAVPDSAPVRVPEPPPAAAGGDDSDDAVGDPDDDDGEDDDDGGDDGDD